MVGGTISPLGSWTRGKEEDLSPAFGSLCFLTEDTVWPMIPATVFPHCYDKTP